MRDRQTPPPTYCELESSAASVDRTRDSGRGLTGSIAVSVYLLALFALWSVLGRYKGIFHDAVVYVLQATARITPDPLAGDLFLRFESQDRFTVFSRFAASMIEMLGVDHAAALLTFVGLCAWFLVAWALAKRLQNERLALLSLGLLMLIPGIYSAMEVFRYAEPFMSARGFAEAISLAALLAYVYNRRVIALALVLVAGAIHPLMAFPVALVMVAMAIGPADWRQWALACLAVTGGAVIGSLVLGLPHPIMDGDWLEVTRQRSSFLFTDRWSVSDWGVIANVLLTLLLGSVVLPTSPAVSVIRSVFAVASTGLVLAVISSQALELRILLQGQPWRWMWIARVIATALLPLILIHLWRSEAAVGRPTALLLACAWLLNSAGSFRDVPPIGVSGLLCLTAVVIWSVRGRLDRRQSLLIAWLARSSSAAVLVVALSFAFTSLDNDLSFGRDPLWVQRIHDMIGFPTLTAIIVGAVWHFTIQRPSRPMLLGSAAAAIVLLYGATPETLRRWTESFYGREQFASFAAWRKIIPTDQEVLWPGSAEASWLLLQRRSYMSIEQGAGIVFSPKTANELLRRAQVLEPMVPPGLRFLEPKVFEEGPRTLTPTIMQQICVDPALGFVVDDAPLSGAKAQADWPSPGHRIYLYDCNDFRIGRRT